MLKKFSLLFLVVSVSLNVLACKKTTDYSGLVSEKPDLTIKTGDYDLDFDAMHNFVIDYILSAELPFFFVVDNGFDISGDNKNKSISITCKCLKGTTVQDLNLFLSLALNGIALNAAEQDYRFKQPSVDSEGTYLDYGNIFDTFSLKIYGECEDKTILIDKKFNPGESITIDPRYIKE